MCDVSPSLVQADETINYYRWNASHSVLLCPGVLFNPQTSARNVAVHTGVEDTAELTFGAQGG